MQLCYGAHLSAEAMPVPTTLTKSEKTEMLHQGNLH